eukprot:13521423-Ditylum_brightwellii.AAC.1
MDDNNTMDNNSMMGDNNGDNDTVELSTPMFSDEEMGDEDDHNSAWGAETVVLDDLVVALLNAMGNDLSFFIREIILRFFAPQENIMKAQAA